MRSGFRAEWRRGVKRATRDEIPGVVESFPGIRECKSTDIHDTVIHEHGKLMSQRWAGIRGDAVAGWGEACRDSSHDVPVQLNAVMFPQLNSDSREVSMNAGRESEVD